MWRLVLLLSSASGGLLRQDKGPDAIVPPALLSCSDRPEWVRFHERVHNELEETGFWQVQDPETLAQANAILDDWSPYVCGGHCRQPQAPSFEFMQDLHAYCTDSKNFERYLVKHYFLNTGQGWSPKEPTGFCPAGFATAAMVVAFAEWPDNMQEGIALLYTVGCHLVGHYFSFDFFESSGFAFSFTTQLIAS
jgi:hypothetical protein